MVLICDFMYADMLTTSMETKLDLYYVFNMIFLNLWIISYKVLAMLTMLTIPLERVII